MLTIIRGVFTSNPHDLNKRKTVIVRAISIFSFYLTGRRGSYRISPSVFIIAGAPWRSPPRHFSHPLQLLLGGLLGEDEACQLSLHPQRTHQHWERCLRLSGNGGVYRYKRFVSWIVPSSSHSKLFLVNEQANFFAADPCGECHEPFKSECHGSERVSWH